MVAIRNIPTGMKAPTRAERCRILPPARSQHGHEEGRDDYGCAEIRFEENEPEDDGRNAHRHGQSPFEFPDICVFLRHKIGKEDNEGDLDQFGHLE